jgi:hypothetical protein
MMASSGDTADASSRISTSEDLSSHHRHMSLRRWIRGLVETNRAGLRGDLETALKAR